MDVIAAALSNVYARRHTINRGVSIVKEAPIMRHFTVELERIAQEETMLVMENGELLTTEAAAAEVLELV